MAAGENGGGAGQPAAAGEAPAAGDGQQIRAKILNPGEPLNEIYVDGALNLQVNEAVAKFEFFNIAAIDSENGEHSWQRTQRLVMPLTAAPRLMAMLQQMMTELQKSGRMRPAPQNQEAGGEPDKG